MKERPILFNGEMVRALLEGRKTQTRRLMKPQPGRTPDDYPGAPGHWWPCNSVYSMVHVERELQNKAGGWEGFAGTICPYGQPGDRLWVRETWQGPLVSEDEMREDPTWAKDLSVYRDPIHCVYRASGDSCEFFDAHEEETVARWKPSIHMPRWACRLLLEVTAVRVERLQDISEGDAIAEGAFFTDFGRQCFHDGAGGDAVKCPAPDDHHPRREGWSMVPTESHEQCLSSARMAFANLWESINGEESWAANPWVWVVEFKRIDGSEVA